MELIFSFLENLLIKSKGEMAERFKVPPWKGGVLERVPGVRISLSPQEKKFYKKTRIYVIITPCHPIHKAK